jgi:hypothetical protein
MQVMYMNIAYVDVQICYHLGCASVYVNKHILRHISYTRQGSMSCHTHFLKYLFISLLLSLSDISLFRYSVHTVHISFLDISVRYLSLPIPF